MRRPQQAAAPAAIAPMQRVAGLDYGVLDRLLGYALRRAQNALYLDFARATEKHGMTPARFAALTLIEANPGLTQNALAQAMGIDRSGALRLADWFAERKLAERRPIARDARLWGLHVTAPGARTLAAMTAAVLAHDEAMAARVGAQSDLLKRLLERLAASGDEMDAKAHKTKSHKHKSHKQKKLRGGSHDHSTTSPA